MARMQTNKVKKARPQLSDAQKVRRRAKFDELTKDVNHTHLGYLGEVQALSKKHGQSERWTRRQLYLGSSTVAGCRAPNMWNGFIRGRLNDINEHESFIPCHVIIALNFFYHFSVGLPKGEHWKLTEFVEAHKETLRHEYSQLSPTQKDNYAIQIMKVCAAKQCHIRDSPRRVYNKMRTSFAAMDQE
ncbi:hypothetical protein PAXRUDRAFT_221832 [Paxillus rubicundulus Ve08.2h10]|uniref:Uncharacterized protein n=1 Tax=Paxillus rubicundulus Ve08.2h10 TaxID=930991 RepID=A0A0D0DA40_9AGAM|nr:hypothetical protein PAXRUDRAFT_221832 [Paxillus rubicundulus Ve08.2h10]